MQVHSRLAIVGDSHAARFANEWQEALPQSVTGVQVEYIGYTGASLNGSTFCDNHIDAICEYEPTHVFLWIGANDLEQNLRGNVLVNGRSVAKQYEYGKFEQVYFNLVHLNDAIFERTGVSPTLFHSLNRFRCRNLMRPIDYNKESMKFNNKIKGARWGFLRTFHMPANFNSVNSFHRDRVHLKPQCYSDLVLSVYERYFLYN